MIQEFVDAFMSKKPALRRTLKAAHPEDYRELVVHVVSLLADVRTKDGHQLDPKAIYKIGDDDYQGCALFIIRSRMGYNYWYVLIDYGSCSHCDTLMNIQSESGPHELPSGEQIDQYLTLCLHIVQRMKAMDCEQSV